MRRAGLLLAGVALACTSVWAIAQDAPESLLPPGFDNPAPRAAPAAAGGGTAARAGGAAAPRAGTSDGAAGAAQQGPATTHGYERLSLEQLEKMTPEELEDALQVKAGSGIPPAARRSLQRMGIIDEREGGLPAGSLANQNASLVRAALAGNKGALVSRWGHILLRRALASRLDAPKDMNPADFTAMRAALLLRMGEADAARALVQDIDPGNYSDALADAALDAYSATGDFTGICPTVAAKAGGRKEPRWQVARDICAAFKGDGAGAMQRLDRATGGGLMPRIDMLLAQKYAGSAGKARRAVTIEWDEVKDMTPWRYGLAIAVGLEPPAELMRKAPPHYAYVTAVAPMVGLERRAEAADRAAGAGVLSSAAMVDLYSQVYADQDINSAWSERAEKLRDAYSGATPAARLAAMQSLWSGADDPVATYSRQVLTAYAAARLPVDADHVDAAGDLVASMLAAGLDQNALRWAGQAEVGSPAWAMLALAAPTRGKPVEAGALESFIGDDESDNHRKSAFLLAGLAGLGRITPQTRDEIAKSLEVDLARQTRWTGLISRSADVNNAALVALLAGLGMQGDGWKRMTPLYLYHIVSALRQVGLEGEARMIAAEAVARG